MASKQLKVGDVVQLKSGGPEMTVNAILRELVHCTWFSGRKNERATFSPAVLVPVEPKTSAGDK